MMTEMKKTLITAGVAVLLGVVALVSAPRRSLPDAFFDVGEPFFPEFVDPESAATLEVVEFDEATASATPFKVTNRNGLWTIPSLMTILRMVPSAWPTRQQMSSV